MCLVPTVTVVIYFGEFIFANALAIGLLATSTLKPSVAAVLFCCGAVAFSLAEYLAHRFVLHSIAPVRHGFITHAQKTLSTRSSGKYGWASSSST